MYCVATSLHPRDWCVLLGIPSVRVHDCFVLVICAYCHLASDLCNHASNSNAQLNNANAALVTCGASDYHICADVTRYECIQTLCCFFGGLSHNKHFRNTASRLQCTNAWLAAKLLACKAFCEECLLFIVSDFWWMSRGANNAFNTAKWTRVMAYIGNLMNTYMLQHYYQIKSCIDKEIARTMPNNIISRLLNFATLPLNYS